MDMLNDREKKILALLSDNPHLSVNEASEALDVSVVTARGVYDSLADKGYLFRVRGGALPIFHPEILLRQKTLPDVKLRIAKAASALVEDGEEIMIEAGTTTALMARFLLGKRDIKVVTDSTLLLPYARSNPSLNLTFVGGNFRPAAESMVGPMALRHLEQFHVKTAFIGTDGFSFEDGLTTHLMDAAEMVRTMQRHADRTVLLADSSKWGRTGFVKILPLEHVNVLVIDSGLPMEAREELKSLGLKIILVPKEV